MVADVTLAVEAGYGVATALVTGRLLGIALVRVCHKHTQVIDTGHQNVGQTSPEHGSKVTTDT